MRRDVFNSTMAKRWLDEIGFYRYLNSDCYLLDYIIDKVTLAGISPNGFNCFPSFLPAHVRRGDLPQRDEVKGILLDIGGTSTRVAYVEDRHSMRLYVPLTTVKNEDLKPRNQRDQSLSVFIEKIADNAHKGCEELDIKVTEIRSLGVVWSNALKQYYKEDIGVSGIVADKALYRKGEWFVSDLHEGTDIGQMFIHGFKVAGFSGIRRIVVSNDVPFTYMAGDTCNGAIICSTGINGTLVRTREALGIDCPFNQIVCNAEMGSGLLIPKEYFLDIDSKKDEVSVEELSSGRYLRILVAKYILAASDRVDSLRGFADRLRERQRVEGVPLRGADVEIIAYKPWLLTKRVPLFKDLNFEHISEGVSYLGMEIIKRAAWFLKYVAIGTILDQMKGDTYKIAVDSRLCAELPVFYHHFRMACSTEKIRKRFDGDVELKLLLPFHTKRGSISVPMMGAANALEILGGIG